MGFKEIGICDLKINPFDLIGNKWALLSAGKPDNFNMMAVSWGHLGVIWGFPSAVAYVRPQRYTREFMDGNGIFTLSFFGPEHRGALKFCGSHSGRDTDKMHPEGLTVRHIGGAVCYEEAELTAVCEKLYAGQFTEDGFCLPKLIGDNYPDRDFHAFYIGRILKLLAGE